MSYHFVNIIDKFEELKISHNNDHYISLIILYIDEYGHYHFLRHKNSNIYSYYPSDIYDNDFKFKKSIKGHILENFNIDDIKKVSHHENDGINHVYIVKLNSMKNNKINYDVNTTNDLSWHIHFDVYNMDPIILNYNETIIRFSDIKNILNN